MSEKHVIVIDGLIGAGKTVLAKKLADRLQHHPYNKKTCVVLEPVNEWIENGIFEKFCDGMDRWAYEFQTYVHVTRVESCIKAFKENPDADVFILERSYYTDKYVFVKMLREQGFISDMQNEMYERWWSMWNRVNPLCATGFIYLKPDLNVCMERVKSRGRKGEETNVSDEYQLALQKAHDEFFFNEENFEGAKRLTLNESRNFRDDSNVLEEIARDVFMEFEM